MRRLNERKNQEFNYAFSGENVTSGLLKCLTMLSSGFGTVFPTLSEVNSGSTEATLSVLVSEEPTLSEDGEKRKMDVT